MIENHGVDHYLEGVKKSIDLDLEIIKGEVDQVPSVGEIKRIGQEAEQREIDLGLKIRNLGKDHILAVVIQVVDQFLRIVDHIQETESRGADPGLNQENHVADLEIIIKKENKESAQHLGRSTKIEVALEVERKDCAGLALILIVILKVGPQDYPEEILSQTLFHLEGKYINGLL